MKEIGNGKQDGADENAETEAMAIAEQNGRWRRDKQKEKMDILQVEINIRK